MPSTLKVFSSFVETYHDNDKNISLEELKKRLTEVYKHLSNDKIIITIKKREPTAYMLFFKEKMVELKNKDPTLTSQKKC